MLVRNKIQIRNRLGIKNSFQGLSPRVVDRRGRETMISVCIVGGINP
jgi:hypothetical protein